jgi:hypothetical protein
MCINPSHLEIGTIADNNRDTFLRGRNAKGERHGNAKLNSQIIRDIRNSQLTNSQLAKQYHVSRKTIFRIRKHELWRHVS